MIMREEHNDADDYFLKKMEENESNSRRLPNNNSPHYSFSLFNLNQKHDLSVEGLETNKNNQTKDTILPKESNEKTHSHPTFFPPPKVMDIGVNQGNNFSKADESVDADDEQEPQDLISDKTEKDLFDNRNNIGHSTSDENKGIDPSVDEEVLIEGTKVGNESVSIREEIFMMLEEEMEEEGNLHQEQENDQELIDSSNDSSTFALEEETYSNLEFEHEENHLPSFSHYLESIYCENKSSQMKSKNTDLVHCIDSLTSVLKKISTEREMINENHDDVEEAQHEHPNLTALKERFENELFSPDQMENVIETTLPDLRSLTVKIPVVLSTLQIEVAIYEDYEFPFPIEHIQSIHWSIKSLKTHTSIPDAIVFVKGTLVAAIEYVSPGETGSIHSIKIPIKWNHTKSTCWILPPNIPKSDQIEYTFRADSNQESTTHHECHYSFCDSIQHSLQEFTFISQHEPLKQNGKSTLKIQGCLQLCLHLTQEQFIQIHSDDSLQ
jgi:hypothetical protein